MILIYQFILIKTILEFWTSINHTIQLYLPKMINYVHLKLIEIYGNIRVITIIYFLFAVNIKTKNIYLKIFLLIKN
jgi:hypothetical protein